MFDAIFTRSLKGFATELRQIRTDIEKLERQREDVLYAPTCRADVAAALTSWATRRSADYTAYLGKALKQLQDVPGVAGDPLQVDQRMRDWGLTGDHREAYHSDIDRALAGLFGNLLAESLQKTIADMPWPEAGLPQSERAGAVAVIDAKLSKLRAAELKLVASAEAAGISVE